MQCAHFHGGKNHAHTCVCTYVCVNNADVATIVCGVTEAEAGGDAAEITGLFQQGWKHRHGAVKSEASIQEERQLWATASADNENFKTLKTQHWLR